MSPVIPSLVWRNGGSERISDSPKVHSLEEAHLDTDPQSSSLSLPPATLRVFCPRESLHTPPMKLVSPDLKVSSDSHQREPHEAKQASCQKTGQENGHRVLHTKLWMCKCPKRWLFFFLPTDTHGYEGKKNLTKIFRPQEICWQLPEVCTGALARTGWYEAGARDDCWECD